MLIVPFEEEDLETAKPLVEMFEKSMNYLNIPLIEKLLVPGGSKKGEVAQKLDIMEKCFNIGKKLG